MVKSDAVNKYLKQTKDLYGDQLFLSLANVFNHVDSSDAVSYTHLTLPTNREV